MPAASSSFAGLPRLLVDHAERRAAVAADEALRCQAARRRRAARCISRQADQRLRAGQEDGAARRAEVVGQAVVGARRASQAWRPLLAEGEGAI